MLILVNFLAPGPETLSYSIKKYGMSDSQDPAFSYIDWYPNPDLEEPRTKQYVFFGSNKDLLLLFYNICCLEVTKIYLLLTALGYSLI